MNEFIWSVYGDTYAGEFRSLEEAYAFAARHALDSVPQLRRLSNNERYTLRLEKI